MEAGPHHRSRGLRSDLPGCALFLTHIYSLDLSSKAVKISPFFKVDLLRSTSSSCLFPLCFCLTASQDVDRPVAADTAFVIKVV